MFTDPKTGETNTAIWFELYHAGYSEITLDSSALPIDELRKHLARFWEHRKYRPTNTKDVG
jgi:hypothetical protein